MERPPLPVGWSEALDSIESLRVKAADLDALIKSIEQMAKRGWSLGHPTEETPVSSTGRSDPSGPTTKSMDTNSWAPRL